MRSGAALPPPGRAAASEGAHARCWSHQGAHPCTGHSVPTHPRV